MLGLLTAIPQYVVRVLLLATLVAFAGTALGINLNALSWYTGAVDFYQQYIVGPAAGLSAWIPIDAIATILTWWLGFFAILFGVRVARFVLSFIAGAGD
jgi:hypothetical protein